LIAESTLDILPLECKKFFIFPAVPGRELSIGGKVEPPPTLSSAVESDED